MKKIKKVLYNAFSFPGVAIAFIVLILIYLFWDKSISEKAGRFLERGNRDKLFERKMDIAFHILNMSLWIVLFFALK